MGLVNDFRRTMAAGAARPEPETATDADAALWAPIDGVTLEQYAELTAGLVRSGAAGPTEVAQWVERRGVPRGCWPRVQAGWVHRIGIRVAVRERYEELYAEQ